jgi:hypothetical protein
MNASLEVVNLNIINTYVVTQSESTILLFCMHNILYFI